MGVLFGIPPSSFFFFISQVHCRPHSSLSSSPSLTPFQSSSRSTTDPSTAEMPQSARGTNSGRDERPDSIAEMVLSSCDALEERLEPACSRGVAKVFCIKGKGSEVFPAANKEFLAQVALLEEKICGYLSVSRIHRLRTLFLINFSLLACCDAACWYTITHSINLCDLYIFTHHT